MNIADEKDNEQYLDDDEVSDEEKQNEIKERWNPVLLEACKTGDLIKLNEAL